MKKVLLALLFFLSSESAFCQLKSKTYSKKLKSFRYQLILYENKEFRAIESYIGDMKMQDHSSGEWLMKNDTLILNIKKLGSDALRMRKFESQEKFILKKNKLKTLTRDNKKITRPVIKIER